MSVSGSLAVGGALVLVSRGDGRSGRLCRGVRDVKARKIPTETELVRPEYTS